MRAELSPSASALLGFLPYNARTSRKMSLAPGTRIGPYEVIDVIGAGGMGEVYLAHDAKLQRRVALKILPEMFAADAERLARFEREARMLAALNHPFIAGIYGFEESNGFHALALEFVDGDTLADRIAVGPIPIDESLFIAKQIVEALEAAHEQGIIHRDLKPANIKITAEGVVKVLDFGLAKLADAPPTSAGSSASYSPTVTSPALMTQAGMLLGTAAYMAPEQAKGRPADKRSDIWAFGCVLYEMVSGGRPFDGEEITDTLAAVLRTEPDWNTLPPRLPAAIRTVIDGCLKKSPRERIGDISAVRFLLNQPPPQSDASAAKPDSPWRLWQAVGYVLLGMAIAGAAVSILLTRRPSSPVQVVRFAVPLSPGEQFTTLARRIVDISPSGERIVYCAGGKLYIRSMPDLEPRPVAGAEKAIAAVFSPDSQSLAFFADGAIKTISVSGGVPVTVYRTGSAPTSLAWDETGILFPLVGTGIVRISPQDGKPEVLVRLDGTEGLPYSPQLLPDGETMLFTLLNADASRFGMERWEGSRLVLYSLTTGKSETIIESGSDGRYVPTGHIVYVQGTTIFARPFDASRRRVVGTPIPVIDTVLTPTAQFAISQSGSLVYVNGPRGAGYRQLSVFDRKGAAEALKTPPGVYFFPRVSPDGNQLAFESTDGKESFVAIYDLMGTSAARRLTYGSNNRFPIWSRDGKHVVYQSDRLGDRSLFWQPVNGGIAEQLTKAGQGTSHMPEAWSPTEDLLLFNVADKSKTALWMLSLSNRKPMPFDDVTSTFIPTDAAFSPDGQWVAYQAGENGTGGEGDLFVKPFPPNSVKYQIARGAGRPLWSRDGKELFYVPSPGRFVAVSVTTQPTFTFTDPVELPRGFGVSGPLTGRMFDITKEGRILGLASPASSESQSTDLSQIRVVLNWTEELKQRVPTK